MSKAQKLTIKILKTFKNLCWGSEIGTQRAPCRGAQHKKIILSLSEGIKFSYWDVPGDPAILEVTPNTSWPDVVYYNSFTHSNMGWKIHIVDNFKQNGGIRSISGSAILPLVLAAFALLL